MPADPPTAFHFAVRFAGEGKDVDASFQEVSGIGPEMEVEAYRKAARTAFSTSCPRA